MLGIGGLSTTLKSILKILFGSIFMRGPWGEQRMLTGFPDEVYPHGEEGGGGGAESDRGL